MFYIIIAAISGCMVLMSMILNSNLSKKIGVFQGTFINFIVGAMLTFIILLAKNNLSDMTFSKLSNIPFWAYLGGAIGVIVVAAANIIIPKIPTIYSTLLIFVGQIFAGIAIDYFTGNFISTGKIVGGLLIVAGLTYNFNVDRKQSIKQEIGL